MKAIDQDYTVLKELGEGLSGEVFLVKKGDKELALKLLKSSIAHLSAEEAKAHFKAEFSLLKQLAHPHIAKILNYGQDPESKRNYFTTEFIEGRDLYTDTRECDLDQVEAFFLQGLRALEYLHSRAIGHYDLKPENLLIDKKTESLKIIDFGLAGFRPRGALAGTPAYMAPEVALGNSPDPRADLYSFGVSFYEVLCGENPFRAKSLSETLKRQERLEPLTLHERNPEVPAALSQVIHSLIQKNPAERPATAGAAIRMYGQLSGKKISLETEETSLSYLPNETKLIGREKELAAFNEAHQRVLRKNPKDNLHEILVIQGPKGIGKTRLLKEFSVLSQLTGIRTLQIKKETLPEITEASCLLIEDLSASQIKRVSLQLFSITYPVLLVLSTSEETPQGDPVSTYSLEPFNRSQVQDYLSALTGTPHPPEKLIEELLHRSKGSPRFLTEILGEAIRRGELLDENGRWSAETLEDLGINFDKTQPSEQFQESFKNDLSSLDQPAQKILRWISIHPAPVTADILQKASGQEDLAYWLIELINHGLLKRLEASRSYQIANPYLRDFILNSIPESDQALMHDKWAKSIKGRKDLLNAYHYHLGRSGYSRDAWDALAALAKDQTKAGDYEDALINYSLAATFPDIELEESTKLKIKIGEELLSLNRLNEARDHFDSLASEIEALPNDQDTIGAKIKTYEKLGITFLKLNYLEKAKHAIQAGLSLLENYQKKELWRQLVLRNYLGRICQKEGKLPEAKQIFVATSGDWKEKLEDKEKTYVTNNDLGEVLLRLGELDEAHQKLKNDFKFYIKIGDHYLQAKCLYSLGEVYTAKKDWDQTIQAYEKCIDLSKKHKFLEILLRAYNGLGNVYHTRHDYFESQKFYERALAIAQKIGDFSSQASLETNLGIVLNAGNQATKAIPHLIAAIHLVERLDLQGIQEKYLMTLANLELVDIHRVFGDFNRAQENLLAAKDLIHKNEQLKSFLMPAGIAQAKLYFDEGKKQEAQEIYETFKDKDLGEDQKTELSKLKNYLSQKGTPTPRQPAITEGYVETGRAEARTLSMTLPGEGHYAKLLELTKFINAETNLDFVLKNILQYALELSQAERGLILLLNDHDRLEVRASINTTLSPNLNEISTRVAEQALSSGEIIETDDATQDDRFNEYQSVMILKLRSILCIPIQSRNKTVGVLYLDNRYRQGAFGSSGLPLLQAFCDQAGIAIENAKLFAKYEKAQKELEARFEKVKEEAEHYHELLGETSGKILPTKYSYDNIVAKSKPMHEVFQTLDKITETNISVYINGETGTGKELIAKALHYNNPQRSSGRFVAINCGGIPPNLIESELFGYKAGAFTGATRDKKGLFVEADGGTLFMDEVADLEMGLQVKLLRALEEREVVPVGDVKPVPFDIRVVSASHRNIQNQVAKGEFREDLYYRLCQIRIPLPPLRDRKEDIPLLVDRFISNFVAENNYKKKPKISGALMKDLIAYDWPGNIRELENTIRVCIALSEGKDFSNEHLPSHFGERKIAISTPEGEEAIKEPRVDKTPQPTGPRIPIDDFNFYSPNKKWEDYERLIYAKAFSKANFKPTQAAEDLGVSSATFYKRIKDFNLSDRKNPVYEDSFVVPNGKTLRNFLEAIVLAAYKCAEEKSYTAIKWLGISQGHFYNVLKSAKKG